MRMNDFPVRMSRFLVRMNDFRRRFVVVLMRWDDLPLWLCRLPGLLDNGWSGYWHEGRHNKGCGMLRSADYAQHDK